MVSPRITREYLLQLIERLRTDKHLSVMALEREAGVPKDTVRDFERGKTQLIRPDRLQKVLNALGYELTITRLPI
jgi:transcriptional regulator with XRE-family HTH domain